MSQVGEAIGANAAAPYPVNLSFFPRNIYGSKKGKKNPSGATAAREETGGTPPQKSEDHTHVEMPLAWAFRNLEGPPDSRKEAFSSKGSFSSEGREGNRFYEFGAPKKKVVYLTPDGPEELKTLDFDAVYVVGGLTDKVYAPTPCSIFICIYTYYILYVIFYYTF